MRAFYLFQYSLSIFTTLCSMCIIDKIFNIWRDERESWMVLLVTSHESFLLCPAGPCIVDAAVMTTHNVGFRWKNIMYVPHNDHVEFRCTRGRPVGSSSMRQKCVEGEMTLPNCYWSFLLFCLAVRYFSKVCGYNSMEKWLLWKVTKQYFISDMHFYYCYCGGNFRISNTCVSLAGLPLIVLTCVPVY